MTRQPVVDQDRCIRCGFCVDTLPGVFRFNEFDLAEVYNPAGAPEIRIEEVMKHCPASCISWFA
ncbi:MAG: ferredoxin [Deltaproteobacteria bacterium]|nr:ferredoxin [Deltaproteobacteria bacterium]